MKISRCLLVAALLPWMTVAQVSSQEPRGVHRPPPPAKIQNSRFAIASPSVNKVWTVGDRQMTSADIAQPVMDNLIQRLSQKGFTRVKTLDSRCCTIQLQVMNVVVREKNLHIEIRIDLLDLDGQNIYFKVYSGNSPAGTAIVGAASDVGKAAMADTDLIKSLAGD